MLIKTFKFLSKEHTVNTGSFQSFAPKKYFPSTKKEAKELIDDYYVKYDEKTGEKLRHTGGDDHVLFPLSFSDLGNKIVQRYIDVMIHKYEIPQSEWEDRIKVNILSTTGTDGNNYIIYVCMFCGLSYKAGITPKEWKDALIEESDISDEASAIKYNVSGEITVTAPTGATLSNNVNGKTSIKIKIESRDRYSVLRNTYIYDYNINEETHRFYKLYLEEDYGNSNAKPVIVTVPRRGKLFLSVDGQDIHDIFDIDIPYSVKRVTGITKEKYKNKIITYDNNDYLDLGAITISTGAGTTIFSGTLYVYSQDRIIDDTVEPLNDIIVYVRTFRIDEYGFREYNPDEQDPTNPVSYQVKANEGFSIEINHGFPYIEFSFKDGEEWWGEDVNNRPVDSYFYMHQLTDQEKLLQIVERDVNMYIIYTSKYKLNISIPHATQSMLDSNSIMTDIICYYDSDEEPMFKKRIKLSRTSEVDECPYFMLTQELPIYSRICVKTIDESYTSMYYNVGISEEFNGTNEIITINSLNKGQTNNIEIYPVTSYNIGIQKFYPGSSRVRYIDIYNHEQVVVVSNQFEGTSLNNLISSGQQFNDIPVEQLFKFVFTKDIISPMPGTPVFINAMDGNDNSDNKYDISRNDYRRVYQMNGKSYIGHFTIDNNCNENISDLTYKNIIPNYYISFNELVNSEYDRTDNLPIDKNVKVFGTYLIRDNDSSNTNSSQRALIDALSQGMSGKASIEAYVEGLIAPCAREDTNLELDKQTAYYTLYNVEYYFDCLYTNQSAVREFFTAITGENYNNREITEGEFLNTFNGGEKFILNIPYDNSLYIKYPHNEEEEYRKQIQFNCKPSEDVGNLTFTIWLYKNHIDNYQINLRSVD